MELIDYFNYVIIPVVSCATGFYICDFIDKFGLKAYRKHVNSQDNYIFTLQKEIDFLKSQQQ